MELIEENHGGPYVPESTLNEIMIVMYCQDFRGQHSTSTPVLQWSFFVIPAPVFLQLLAVRLINLLQPEGYQKFSIFFL